MEASLKKDILTIFPTGKINTYTSIEVEKEINDLCEANDFEQLVLDVDKVEYFSSAGLRILLRLKKKYGVLKIVNASPLVYEVMDMTGFTEIIPVEKAYRKISVEGCPVLGKGAKGTVYRIDPETIVKVYYTPDSVDEIHKERELARTAFILGVPTAISYAVVKVDEYYGSVFELLNATSISKMLQDDSTTVEACVKLSIDLLKLIHATEVEEGQMPPILDKMIKRARAILPYLPDASGQKLLELMEAIPDDHHMIHGDYHMKNVMVQNGEPLLIDMDTICYGHPIFELSFMYTAYIGFGEWNSEELASFFDLPVNIITVFWKRSLAMYLNSDDPARVEEVEKKAAVLSYVRLMERMVRKSLIHSDQGQAEFEYYRKKLISYLDEISELTF